MPLFFCPICGWTTTASMTLAARAHQLGVPACDGILEPVAYAGKRLTNSADVGESDPGQAPRTAAATDTTSP